MKGNVSGYVCNHGSPSGERDTASSRLGPCFRRKLQTKKLMMFSRRHLYCGTPVVTSWAVGPTGGVFTYDLQTRVTLKAFPVATPRGRSVSFPTRGTMVTYVTWDVLWHSNQQVSIWWLATHTPHTRTHACTHTHTHTHTISLVPQKIYSRKCNLWKYVHVFA